MFGYIYITTNKLNGKRYIGQKTSPVFLGNKYLGSGEALQLAINKYGKQSFEVELIEECNSRHELNIREAYYISYYNAVKSPDFYNLKEGGHGGSIKGQTHHTSGHKKYMSKRMSGKNNPNYGSQTNHWTAESFLKASSANKGVNNPNYGKHHSAQTRELISQKSSGRHWITNGASTKRVLTNQLYAYLQNGWKIGRLLSSTTIEN